MQSLGHNQKKSVAGAVVITINARLIVKQEPISTIEGIPNLPDHQLAAKAHSKDWQNNIWPLIIQNTTDIIDYGNMFTSACDQLNSLIPDLESKDPIVAQKAKDQFTEVLQALLQNLGKKKISSSTIATKIKKFHDDFQPLYNKFDKDFTEADKRINRIDQKIALKTVERKMYNLEARGYIYAIVGTAVALPVTLISTAILAPPGIGLLVGGILILAEIGSIPTILVFYILKQWIKFTS